VNKNQYFVLFVFSLVLLCLVLPTYGQNVWEKKPYQQWSELDAEYALIRSPWGKDEREDGRSYSVNVRLHSALPIRQAIVRLKQIFLKYDKFTAADKAKFDSEVKDFLECPGCAKYYILTLRMLPIDLNALRELQGSSLDNLKPYIFLTNDKGERRTLAQYLPPVNGGERALFHETAVFFFERFDGQGKPLITTDNKEFYFTIDKKLFKGKMVEKFTFEVSKLLHNGEIIF